MIHPEKDRFFSDSLKVNFGNADLVGKPFTDDSFTLVHCDNDHHRWDISLENYLQGC